MSPGPPPPLSAKARALLAAEREISPQPDLVRRRALLRARTALWHARRLPPERPERPERPAQVKLWKRVRLITVAALGATSAVAAWSTIRPAPLPDRPPTVVTSPLPHHSPQRAPRSMTLPAEPVPAEPTPQEQPLPPRDKPELDAEKPARKASGPARSRASAQKRGAASDELVLLDRARRAVVAADFRTALNIIQRHARSFPNTQLGEEREALRVKALKGAGLSEADQAARDFESRYPKSVLAPELNKRHRTAP